MGRDVTERSRSQVDNSLCNGRIDVNVVAALRRDLTTDHAELLFEDVVPLLSPLSNRLQ